MHLEAVSEAILESRTGAFHETFGFNNFGKSTELLLCLWIVERASHASEENFVKNKRFMLSEGILERILQNKPCFKFRKHVNATNSLSVYISNKPNFFFIELDFSAYKPVCPLVL